LKLTTRSRNWLYFNIKKYHTDDLYLKHLDHSIILSEFKSILDRSWDTEVLVLKLNTPSFNKSFRFYRKDGKDFIYPSFLSQITSLLDCWEEIRTVYASMYKGVEDEYFDFIDNEPFADEIDLNKIKLTRKSYGNKANVNSVPHFMKEVSIYQHIMSANSSIRCGFGRELGYFKKRCLQEFKKVENREKWKSYFFQTDMISFFHCLQVETIKEILAAYDLQKSFEWLDRIGEEFPDGGLPIGWILSGFLADLVLVEFSNYIENKKPEFRSSLGLVKVEMINYVDDLVFFIASKEELNRKDFPEKFSGYIQTLMDIFFKDSEVQIHDANSHKVKFIELNESAISLLKTNWHEFDFFVSGENESIAKKWTALDDFLLPSDNDLILNEKVQFFNNLKNLKSKLENDEIRTVEEFQPYLDKIIYKLSVDRKYLHTVLDTVFLFLAKDDIGDIAPVIDRLWDFIRKIKDGNSLYLINFLSCMSKHTKMKDTDYAIFDKLAKRAMVYIGQGKDFSNTQDNLLLESYLCNFYISNQNSNIQLCHVSKYDSLYFLRTSCAALTTARFLRGEKFKLDHLNEVLAFEVLKKFHRLDQLMSGSDFLSNMSHLLKAIPLKLRSDFFSKLLSFSSYYFVPQLNEKELGLLVELIDEYEVDNDISREIKNLLGNYRYHFDLDWVSLGGELQRFISSLNTSFKKPSVFKFNAISKPTKPYLLYKEILCSIAFSFSTYKDLVRFMLFQYAPIDSFVFYSWKSLPQYFGPYSHISLSAAKSILRTKVKSLNIAVTKGVKIAIEKKKLLEALTFVEAGRILTVDLDFFQDQLTQKSPLFASEKLKLTLSNPEIDVEKDFDPSNHLRLTTHARTRTHLEIMQALRQASKMKSKIICFPELTLPHQYLATYLNFAGNNDIVLMGGLEYLDINSNTVVNATVISFPTNKRSNPLGKSYHAYLQVKNFLSIKEISAFETIYKGTVNIKEGSGVFLFKSSIVNNFSVLTCSDFLSIEIKESLQGIIQSLFVPAMNFDNTTYAHVAQSAIREIYCICTVCNNSFMGSSYVCAPFKKDSERTLFKIEGKAHPKAHTLVINPAVLSEVQKYGEDKKLHFDDNPIPLISDPLLKLSDFKQVPPDWSFIRKKRSA
jgi:hypothetical protein